MSSKILVKKSFAIGSKHVAHIKLQRVPKNETRPDGFKLNCALIDLDLNKPVLILDNHKPFGYHIHAEPHIDHSKRETIEIKHPKEAIKIFVRKARELSK